MKPRIFKGLGGRSGQTITSPGGREKSGGAMALPGSPPDAWAARRERNERVLSGGASHVVASLGGGHGFALVEEQTP